MKTLALALGLLLSSLTNPAAASDGESMTDFFTRSIEAMTQTVSQSLNQELGNEGPIHYENWMFSHFQLRIRPAVGFQVPAMTSLRVLPEVELMWERKPEHSQLKPPE